MTLRTFILAFLAAVIASVDVIAACPPRLLTRLAAQPTAYRDRVMKYWRSVPQGSEAERGMILVLEKGGNRGAEFLSGIIETFPDSAQDQLRRLDALRNASGVEDQINALARKSAL